MNECCDWHAICLNEKENVQLNNELVNMYISYCPECNTVHECENGKLSRVEGEKKEIYKNKYKEKINQKNKSIILNN